MPSITPRTPRHPALLFVGDAVLHGLLEGAACRLGRSLLHASSGPEALRTLDATPLISGVLLAAPNDALRDSLAGRPSPLPVAVLPLPSGAPPFEHFERALDPHALLSCALRELDAAGRGARPDAGLLCPNDLASQTRPCVIFTRRPDGARVAVAAYHLAAVTVARPDEQADALQTARAFHDRLVGVAALLAPGTTLRLRYTATRPAPAVYLLLEAPAPETASRPPAMDTALEALASLLAPPLAVGLYRWTPVAAPRALADVLAPFPVRAAVRLAPPLAPTLSALRPFLDDADDDDLDVALGAADGPDDLDDPAADEEADPDLADLPLVASHDDPEAEPALAAPLTDRPAPTLAALLDVLARLPMGALVDVALLCRPTRVYDYVVLLAHARAAVQAARRLVPGAAALGARAARLIAEHAHALTLSLTVASEADEVPALLCAEAARAFVGAPATTSFAPLDVLPGLDLPALFPPVGASWGALPAYVTSEEAAARFRLPLPVPLPGLAPTHPRLWATPADLPAAGIAVGTAPDGRTVRLAAADLLAHGYACGATGAGKSTFLKNLALSLAENGAGVGLIDPHGDLGDALLAALPEHRRADLVVFDPADADSPHAFNPLSFDPDVPGARSLVIDELLALFNEWYDMKVAGGPAFEQYFRNALLLLMSGPGEPPVLGDVMRVFSDRSFRRLLLATCPDEDVCHFWEMAEHVTHEGTIANYAPYVTNKLSRFTQHELLARLTNVRHTTLDFRAILDEGRILVVRLSKGKLGREGTALFGSFLLARLLQAALSREALPPDQRRAFFLLVDEAQSFVSPTTANLLNETRKYGLGLFLATQATTHLRPDVLDAVLANVGTLLAFRCGVHDAERLSVQLAGAFTRDDLLTLPNLTAACRIVSAGRPLPPFLLTSPVRVS